MAIAPVPTPIVLAYFGGLDPSFLVPWLAEQQQRPVITVTVDTGGIDAGAARTLAERSRALGAVEHHQVEARADYFEQVLRFLIMGNVRRGQLYPLCVGAERVMQAQTIARMARELKSDTVAHGCTAAGNDQVRFEVALRTLAQAPARTGLPAAARPAGAGERRALFDQPRPVGRHHRRTRDAHLCRQHPGRCLAADARCFHPPARAPAPRAHFPG